MNVNYYEHFVQLKNYAKNFMWSVAYRMPLNLNKAVVMTFPRMTMLVKYDYHIAGSSTHHVNLGVNFDTKITFTIGVITAKTMRDLGLLLWVS